MPADDRGASPTPSAQVDQMLDLTDMGLITDIRLDLTTRCNLRCAYCAVSQPDYVGEDMPDSVVQAAIAHVGRLARYHELSGIGVNGHGETTFIPGWAKSCSAIVRLGLPVDIITNLAKRYTMAEIGILASMMTISISIDTVDPDLLRRIRRKVRIDRIVDNIKAVQTAASLANRRAPKLQFFCGLFDKNAEAIEALAGLAITLGIQKIVFWNLNPQSYDDMDIPVADRVHPLGSLDDGKLRDSLLAVERATTALEKADIEVQYDGPFIADLRRRVGLDA